jgi:hypothetical protein
VQIKTQAGNQLSELMKKLKDQTQSIPSFKPFPGLRAKVPSKAGGVNPGVTVKNRTLSFLSLKRLRLRLTNGIHFLLN